MIMPWYSMQLSDVMMYVFLKISWWKELWVSGTMSIDQESWTLCTLFNVESGWRSGCLGEHTNAYDIMLRIDRVNSWPGHMVWSGAESWIQHITTSGPSWTRLQVQATECTRTKSKRYWKNVYQSQSVTRTYKRIKGAMDGFGSMILHGCERYVSLFDSIC